MDRTFALSTLSAKLAAGEVPARDKDFMSSLVTQSKRGLSERQWYWVAKLAEKFTTPPAAPVQVTDFGRVYRMFNAAKAHLKHPKVRLNVDGQEITLYLSGPASRVPDVVNVVNRDTNGWYGRVYPDGRWERGSASQNMEGVLTMLDKLAANPEEVAAAHGKLTGNCCFCSRALSDDRSTDVGYGPVCAKRYGLTWGGK